MKTMNTVPNSLGNLLKRNMAEFGKVRNNKQLSEFLTNLKTQANNEGVVSYIDSILSDIPHNTFYRNMGVHMKNVLLAGEGREFRSL